VQVDANAPGQTLRHVWPFFGFDECNFAYTENAKELMKTLSSLNRGTAYLRCHFLLNTGDGTPAMKWGSTNAYTEDAAGNVIYDWKIMDKIFDAMIDSNCQPLVEIGFMPKALSVKPEPYQHKYPPDMWAGWAYPPKD
jgi:xylan 1,4-beta-xylosidase